MNQDNYAGHGQPESLNEGRKEIAEKCQAAGLDVLDSDVRWAYEHDGYTGYTIDGMPWREWFDAMTD